MYLSKSRRLSALCLVISLYACIGLNDNFWSPFLPTALQKSGLSDFKRGILISSSDFSAVFFALLFMVVETSENRPLLLTFGGFLTGLATLVFGQLDVADPDVYFLTLGIILRSVMGLGISLLWCNGAPMFYAMFPNSIGKITSSISSAISIGMLVAAPVGSFLYKIGGYKLPFYVVGGVQMILPLVCYLALPGSSATQVASADKMEAARSSDKNVTVFDFLCNFGVLATSCAAISVASALGFFSVTLAPHLSREFAIDSGSAGPYFLSFTLVRVIFGPIFGYLTDRGHAVLIFTVCGGVANLTGFTILGFTGYVHAINGLICLQMLTALIGVSTSAAFVPFVTLLRKTCSADSPANAATVDKYSAILYTVCFGLGLIMGQSFTGGLVIENIGFHCTCWVQSAVCLVTYSLALICSMKGRRFSDVLKSKLFLGRYDSEAVENEPEKNSGREKNVVDVEV